MIACRTVYVGFLFHGRLRDRWDNLSLRSMDHAFFETVQMHGIECISADWRIAGLVSMREFAEARGSQPSIKIAGGYGCQKEKSTWWVSFGVDFYMRQQAWCAYAYFFVYFKTSGGKLAFGASAPLNLNCSTVDYTSVRWRVSLMLSTRTKSSCRARNV